MLVYELFQTMKQLRKGKVMLCGIFLLQCFNFRNKIISKCCHHICTVAGQHISIYLLKKDPEICELLPENHIFRQMNPITIL
jgi:hypothetical protein